MITIEIGNQAQTWYTLSGGSLPEGLLGAVYEPACSAESLVQERILLTLKGTHAQMDAILEALEMKLTLAREYNQHGVGMPQYLKLRAQADGLDYVARLLSATLEPLPHSLAYYASGSLSVAISFTRENHFDSAEIQIPLTSNPLTGVALVNHDDSAHNNTFFVDRDEVETQLPAPLRLEITNTYASGTLKDIWIGSIQNDLYSPVPSLILEGELGSGGTTVSSATASNGAFQRLTWSASGWSDLTEWDLSAEDLYAFRGRTVLPMLRFANTPSVSGLLLRLSAASSGVTLYEGGEINVPAGMGYLALSPLRLPCGELQGLDYPAVQQLHLQAYKPGSSSATLDVDDLLLIPQDSFRSYKGLIGLGQNDQLIDDAFTGISYSKHTDYELGSHITLGEGHFIQPNQAARFMIFQGDGNNLAPIDRSISVRAWYRRRRRIL